MAVRCGRSVVTHRVGDGGSALVEALIGVAVVVAITTGVALLLVRSRQAVAAAGAQSAAAASAQQKLEQLCALEWVVDAAGTRRSDRTSDLAGDLPSAGGTGLAPTPAGVLDRSAAGFADFLAADGGWRSRAPDSPRDAAFERRWSIASYDGDPEDTLVLTVIVLPIGGDARAPLARLQTIRTRTAR